jgi:hypothetical protein
MQQQAQKQQQAEAASIPHIPIPAKTILPERDYFPPSQPNPAPEIPNLLIRVFPAARAPGWEQ